MNSVPNADGNPTRIAIHMYMEIVGHKPLYFVGFRVIYG